MVVASTPHYALEQARDASHGGDGWEDRAPSSVDEIGSVWAEFGVGSECGTLRAVLMHRPGPEIDGITDAARASGTKTSPGKASRNAAKTVSIASSRVRRKRVISGTVTVTDVLPNGNLILRGTREITIQGDNRTLIVTEVVRAYDISPDNTVNSRLVSDLRMFYDGKGAEQAFTKQGWLGRIGNKVWPF